MNTLDLQTMFSSTLALLGARLTDSDVHGCQFDYLNKSFTLSACEGASGSYVIGQMKLAEIRPDRDASQVLLGMYINYTLFRSAKFPIWCAMNPDDNVISMVFSLYAGEVNATILSEIVARLADPQFAAVQFEPVAAA